MAQGSSYTRFRTIILTPRNGHDVGLLASGVNAFGLEGEKAGAGLSSVSISRDCTRTLAVPYLFHAGLFWILLELQVAQDNVSSRDDIGSLHVP